MSHDGTSAAGTAGAAVAPPASDKDTPTAPTTGTTSFRVPRFEACLLRGMSSSTAFHRMFRYALIHTHGYEQPARRFARTETWLNGNRTTAAERGSSRNARCQRKFLQAMSLLALSWTHRYPPELGPLKTCFSESSESAETDMGNSHGRFLWYQLLTTDVEAAKAFYVEVVGWGTQDASAPGMPYTLFTAFEASVAGLMALSENATIMGARPGWLGYVGVDDVDATADRIQHLGGVMHVSPMDIPDVSRFSIVADPQMATVGLFKGMKPRQEQVADPHSRGRVGWHELLAADWEQVWPFYDELFGWQKAEANVGTMGEYQQFSAGGKTIGGMMNKPPMVPDPCWLYYFNIGDIDAAVKRVRAGGGQVLRGPTEVLNGNWIVQCLDPQGAMFALMGQRGVGYFERADRVRKRSEITSR